MIQADPAADAREALTWWPADWDGRPQLPIDPIRLARDLGVDVFVSDLKADLSGVLVKRDAGTPEIHLNVKNARVRQNFTCAHEIGHYWRRRGAVDNFGYIDNRDTLSGRGVDPEEIYANQFAAELLMPESEVREYSERGYSPERLAQIFGVSVESMRYRFKNLQLRD